MNYRTNKPSIHVSMLGDFTVSIGSKSITDDKNQAKKPWLVLEYLITFRNRAISQEELIDLIWSDDNSTNPQGALKTLVFRSRRLLVPLEVPVQDLIVQTTGAYAWNSDFDTVVDVDQFELLAKKIISVKSDLKSHLSECLCALDLYKGKFLPKSSFETWVVPLSSYYHSLYVQVLFKTIELLNEEHDYETIVSICRRAIKIDNFDEEVHYQYIYALYNSGQQNQALEHYNATTEMFYNEFSITPSEKFQHLYKIIQDTKHGITTDLTVLQKKLSEESTQEGAYYCEYAVFKDIYQLEARSIERTGDSIYICLITISEPNGDLPRTLILSKAMDEMSESIRASLRRGDVFTRSSISQFMLLLPTASYENGDMVMKRIIRTFKKNYTRRELSVQYSLQAFVPC